MLLTQVLSLAGEMLGNAEGLLQDGLHPTEIADGYQKASVKVCAPDGLAHGLASGMAMPRMGPRQADRNLALHDQALEILDELVLAGSDGLDMRNREQVRVCKRT